jgi:hypothetical protein
MLNIISHKENASQNDANLMCNDQENEQELMLVRKWCNGYGNYYGVSSKK